MARVRTSAVSLSLPVGPSLDGTSGIVGSRSRVLLAAGALAASALLARALRRSPSDALRRRLLRRLDRIAPRVRYTDEIGAALSNGTCPVCLGDFAAAPERLLRVQTCGHALCAECLEGWVVHQAKSHLNPSRFGMTRGGDIVSWHCPPCCPMCRGKIAVISDEDIREAVLAAINAQGGALSTFANTAYPTASQFMGGLSVFM